MAQLNRNWVEYFLFPDTGSFEVESTNSTFTPQIGRAPTPPSQAQRLGLELLRIACLDLVAPHVRDFVWSCEPFCLTLAKGEQHDLPETEGDVISKEGSVAFAACGRTDSSCSGGGEQSSGAVLPPHLYGRTCFGDTVEDEWFIVWLLCCCISAALPQLSIAVRDNDGEFLLIEGALALPKWLKPSNSTNRVFLRQGKLHIVPKHLPAGSPRLPCGLPPSTLRQPSLVTSLALVRNAPQLTEAPTDVQAAALQRVQGYPKKARQSMHHAWCRVPRRVAQVLREEPQLLSWAVQCFAERDLDDLEAAVRMGHFYTLPQSPRHCQGGASAGKSGPSPMLGPGDNQFQYVRVRFPRTLFALLALQDMEAPPNFPMPSASHPDWKRAQLGLKLTCAFEMAFSRCWRQSAIASAQDQGQGQGQGKGLFHGPAADTANTNVNVNDNAGSNGEGVPESSWLLFLEALQASRLLDVGDSGPRDALHAARRRYEAANMLHRLRRLLDAPAPRVAQLLASPLPSIALPFPPAPMADDDEGWLLSGPQELLKEVERREQEEARARPPGEEGQRNAGEGAGKQEVEPGCAAGPQSPLPIPAGLPSGAGASCAVSAAEQQGEATGHGTSVRGRRRVLPAVVGGSRRGGRSAEELLVEETEAQRLLSKAQEFLEADFGLEESGSRKDEGGLMPSSRSPVGPLPRPAPEPAADSASDSDMQERVNLRGPCSAGDGGVVLDKGQLREFEQFMEDFERVLADYEDNDLKGDASGSSEDGEEWDDPYVEDSDGEASGDGSDEWEEDSELEGREGRLSKLEEEEEEEEMEVERIPDIGHESMGARVLKPKVEQRRVSSSGTGRGGKALGLSGPRWMQSYSDAMEKELATTSVRVPGGGGLGAAQTLPPSKKSRRLGQAGAPQGSERAGIELLNNLRAAKELEMGTPGPASAMLAALGWECKP